MSISIVLHTLYGDETEIAAEHTFPFERMTVAALDELIFELKRRGFRFIRPEEWQENSSEKQCLLTFDDGYFNNFLALPVLEKHQVPATFAISTGYIASGESFWWDIHFRERRKAGWQLLEILAEQNEWKKLPFSALADLLPQNRMPLSDIDRPMKEEELAAFAANPWVVIGNHTHNHAILPHYSASEIRTEIRLAQKELQRMTGKLPTYIAYPNGDTDAQTIKICKEEGLHYGTTADVGTRKDAMQIRRFTLSGALPIREQIDWMLVRGYWY